MLGSAFRLTKWYLDCVTPDGVAVIVYVGRLVWRRLRMHYASRLVSRPGRAPEATTSLWPRRGPREQDDGRFRYTSPALGLDGFWNPAGPGGLEHTVYEGAEGRVVWHGLAPAARVELELDGVRQEGVGYLERLELTVPPWRLPIEELRWGRFVADDARAASVWIDWRGPHRFSLTQGGEGLRLAEPRTLRSGPIVGTALASVPGVRQLFPEAILGLDETKWLSRGVLPGADGVEREGWVIHEVVRWVA